MTRRAGPSSDGGLWVFGYGSLMWRPDFPHRESQPALLNGYHRALCIYSTQYRGTRECPGLVLGLDRGGSCRGRAFLVAPDDAGDVMDYLHEREMTDDVYIPSWVSVALSSGKRVTAYAFVADRRHAQYTGRLRPEDTVRLIVQGHGRRGSCLDYVRSTIHHLDELGIADGPMHRMLVSAEEIAVGGPGTQAHFE